jgi:hypothetical protein
MGTSVSPCLKAKEEMWGVFPPQWRVPQLLCMSLCKLTRWGARNDLIFSRGSI